MNRLVPFGSLAHFANDEDEGCMAWGRWSAGNCDGVVGIVVHRVMFGGGDAVEALLRGNAVVVLHG